jgi:hypothetical protein
LNRSGADVPFPGWPALKDEQYEEAPAIEVEISDESGAIVSRFDGTNSGGTHRVTWNMRWPSVTPVQGGVGGGGGGFGGAGGNAGTLGGNGPLVAPGTYRVQLFKRVNGVRTVLTKPSAFAVQLLPNATTTPAERVQAVAYYRDAQPLQRQVLGDNALMAEVSTRLDALQRAVEQITKPTTLDAEVRAAVVKLLLASGADPLAVTSTGGATALRRRARAQDVELLDHRQPRYAAMARWGVTVTADEVAQVRDAAGFTTLVSRALERRGQDA